MDDRSLSNPYLPWLRDELARHPWIAPGLALTASAAFGSALPSILGAIAQVLR